MDEVFFILDIRFHGNWTFICKERSFVVKGICRNLCMIGYKQINRKTEKTADKNNSLPS